TPVGDLTHRVPLELVGEIGFAHKGLLASKLGKKASTNLGAIHSLSTGVSQFICIDTHYSRHASFEA
ncbi:hypothetical protein, partial [Devosia submarina]|uniref:hypothetical protein n=1 Tax=Devosia submarina TaxID=1173082 RepID=UPI001AECB030